MTSINRVGKVGLSPAYDLLNTTIALPDPAEEIALPVGGKKRNLTEKLLVDYFGMELLKLTEDVVYDVLSGLRDSIPGWLVTIEVSFLSDTMKEKYIHILSGRRAVLGL